MLVEISHLNSFLPPKKNIKYKAFNSRIDLIYYHRFFLHGTINPSLFS